jgi:hypothetical protein
MPHGVLEVSNPQALSGSRKKMSLNRTTLDIALDIASVPTTSHLPSARAESKSVATTTNRPMREYLNIILFQTLFRKMGE